MFESMILPLCCQKPDASLSRLSKQKLHYSELKLTIHITNIWVNNVTGCCNYLKSKHDKARTVRIKVTLKNISTLKKHMHI